MRQLQPTPYKGGGFKGGFSQGYQLMMKELAQSLTKAAEMQDPVIRTKAAMMKEMALDLTKAAEMREPVSRTKAAVFLFAYFCLDLDAKSDFNVILKQN